MSAPLILLIVVLLLAGLSVAGAVWGADSRAPGGWTSRSDAAPLWPTESTRVERRMAERSLADR